MSLSRIRRARMRGYRLESVYASTETSTVYRATGERDGRVLLVKLASPARRAAARRRLGCEATALAGLAHPNLVRLAGSAGAGALVFEPVGGAPVRSRALPLAAPEAVRVIGQVLDALGEVHAHGLVHRDVRPDNIWLADDGRAVLANFELACRGVTHPAQSRGTLPYASPEQCRGDLIDARSDLYSCAVTLWELATGQVPPWLGPGRARPATPPPAELTGPLVWALSEQPARRPDSAAQFADALRRGVAGRVVARATAAAGVRGW